MALVDSVCFRPPPALLTAARQQGRRGTKMINNHWQALGIGLLDTLEIARIVANNTTRIDLLLSEPYYTAPLEQKFTQRHLVRVGMLKKPRLKTKFKTLSTLLMPLFFSSDGRLFHTYGADEHKLR